MDKSTKTEQPLPEQFSDILLVLDKQEKKIKAVKGIDKQGTLETVAPEKKNRNQFMKVDKHGDVFSNFFSNFTSQLNNPTRFSFFRIPSLMAVNIAKVMQEHLTVPTLKGKELMDQYKIETPIENNHKNQNSMETTQNATQNGEYRYQPEQIDWKTLSGMGLSRERLEKMNLLDPLLKGYKTNELVPLSLHLGSAVTRMDARLSLQTNDQGQVLVAIHGIRKEPQLHFPFFGHEFSKEDKENLLKTGNMGRVVELTNTKTGETIPSIISVDRLTNELIALRTEWIKIPDEIKGIKLNEEQKQTLQEGKPLYLEDMISKKGEPFNATVQFNADKRYVEFLFDRNLVKNQSQNKGQSETTQAPKVIRGKELDDQQYQKFNDGQTIYLDGLLDKQGKPYQGYFTFNKETGKTAFSFDNPDKIKEKAQPSEAHKTQTAVNSQGKTNEATKNLKEPLKSGQQKPDSKEQQEQQEKTETPVRSRGRKM